jgi:hypothetical protein
LLHLCVGEACELMARVRGAVAALVRGSDRQAGQQAPLDRIIGISEPGGAFDRDASPGTYRVTVNNVGYDVNQFADVTLSAGQRVFIRVESLRFWWGDGRSSYRADTFYTRPIPHEAAQAEVARRPFYGGG